jgi:hypothetical protein
LEVPLITFKSADTISIMPECSLEVLHQLENVKANRFYLEYEGVEGLGLGNTGVMLPFSKIRVNLVKSALVGGYGGLFRVFCNPSL